MTQLRKKMLEELQRRNYSKTTIRHYLRQLAKAGIRVAWTLNEAFR